MRKSHIKTLVLIMVVAVAGIWLYNKLEKLPSLSNIFSSKPVVIDKTPIVLKEIKTIAQLVTVTSYDEVVVDSVVYNKMATILDAFRAVTPMAVIPSMQKQLVLVAKGKVLAGTDLQKLDSSSITISNDTLTILLPRAQILEAIVNPSDFETFEERGEWSDTEVTAVKLKARSKLIARAMDQQILVKADAKAKAVIQSFLENAGFSVVYVNIAG